MKFFKTLREINRRGKVFSDAGFVPTMRDRCLLFGTEKWRPGTVYARGDERICIKCLCSWNVDRYEATQEAGFVPQYVGLNQLHYEPKTLEEIGAKLFPEGFSIKPPGQIVPT